ncbi:MAG: DUF4291 domain-containing protein [Planctomycetaceae bacterium]|nr:DUF4291 domain-containing protein [Planctomycetaceae bacterium]
MSARKQFPLATTSYADQWQTWPDSGRHILAQLDDDTIVVYQAYREQIGHFAAEHGYFGGEFKYTRMSWIKPNFLWMMYRSDWGRSQEQEVVLAIRLRREFFDSLLQSAVYSSFGASRFQDINTWKDAVNNSSVRLQWDPDHLPTGGKCERRAVQLGLRGDALEAFSKREALEIIDVSEFVAEQRAHIDNWQAGTLQTPREHVYVPADSSIATHLGLDVSP